MNMFEVLPTAALVLELAPEELAALLLLHLNQGAGEGLSPHNFSLLLNEHFQNDRTIVRAFMEAWGWLVREGLLAEEARGGDWFFVTRRGRAIKGRDDFSSFRASHLLPRATLHPTLAEHVWSSFVRGEYDTAVFQAFREVEVTVRRAAALPDTVFGVDLMGKAFNTQNGVLADASLPEAERKAMAALFAGAVGLFKNPTSHRHIVLSNPAEAAEIISFASVLMRIVDVRATAMPSPVIGGP